MNKLQFKKFEKVRKVLGGPPPPDPNLLSIRIARATQARRLAESRMSALEIIMQGAFHALTYEDPNTTRKPEPNVKGSS